ncbi:Hypothetical predicted protein [Mytilus galloprovincialis]|uniref:Uncharacterized protein n=1 Tax=Mytilus galloprovincialis TaxID=29158 RepID=A0A8B6DWE5_MYTGA|nr:Hypothetical predicted protein [Mytilus galloprovincialis]
MRFISRLDYNFSDSGSVIAVSTGAIICAVLVFVCIAVCCIQKYQNKRRNLPTHQRGIPQIQTVSNQFHEFNTTENGQLDVPPRYSELYPVPSSSDQNSIDRSRQNSVGNRSLSSINRNSDLRRPLRRGSNSGSSTQTENSSTESNQNNAPSTTLQEIDNKTNEDHEQSSAVLVSENSSKCENNDTPREDNLAVGNSNDTARSSFMTSIVETLPNVFESDK